MLTLHVWVQFSNDKNDERNFIDAIYIFLPYLSSNLAGLLDTVEDAAARVDGGGDLEKAGRAVATPSRCAGATCPSASAAQRVPRTCRLGVSAAKRSDFEITFFILI